jgi:hypothetical protein
MSYAQTALFAIQAGLRLYGATRKAYADSVRGCALILPLPRAPGVLVDTAENWFLTSNSGIDIVQQTPRIRWLMEQTSRSEAQNAELVDLYRFYRSPVNPSHEDAEDVRGELSNDEMFALLEVRQWSDDEANSMANPLQTITGTLVNIAIDYFVQTPGVVSEDRSEGRALKAFFEALDDTEFAKVPPKEIATGLMVAVLDTVSSHPDFLSGGENEKKLIMNVSKSLAESAKGFLEDATDKERRDAGVWVQLIGHAVFKGAAETVLADPGRYFKVRPDAESEIVVEIGNTFTNLLLGERQLEFRELFSAQGLNKVAKSALAAVAKNPEILKIDNKGVENIIVSLSENLSRLKNKISADIFPEVVRLVLDKSADNLDLLWGKSFKSPRRHLLVMATDTLLKSISKTPPAGSTWKPQFTPDQLIEVANSVLDEVVNNPAWILNEAGNASGCLQAAVEAILEALHKVPGNRISAETGVAILRSGIGAVALRLSLLDELADTAEQPAKVAVSAALEAIFGEVFADGVSADDNWDLARNSTLQTIAEIALDKLAKFGATKQEIEKLRQAVQELVIQDTPFNPEGFANRLDDLLAEAA